MWASRARPWRPCSGCARVYCYASECCRAACPFLAEGRSAWLRVGSTWIQKRPVLLVRSARLIHPDHPCVRPSPGVDVRKRGCAARCAGVQRLNRAALAVYLSGGALPADDRPTYDTRVPWVYIGISFPFFAPASARAHACSRLLARMLLARFCFHVQSVCLSRGLALCPTCALDSCCATAVPSWLIPPRARTRAHACRCLVLVNTPRERPRARGASRCSVAAGA